MRPTALHRTAVHRLRDLDRRGWLVVAAVVAALVAPFVASVVRAVDVGWTPSNDEALITLRVRDVLAGELPLIGQPSTAEQYATTDPPHHPGPIEFYLLVPFVAALGSDVGVLVGAGAFNVAGVLVAAWVAFRRAGPAVGLGAAVVLAGVAWAQGLAVLTDPISSNMGGIPLLGLAALAWAVVDGDLRLLPLAAAFFAFVCQQHLAIVGVATGTAAWAGLGLVLAVATWARTRRGDRAPATDEPGDGASDDGASGHGTGAVPSPWPWIGAAVAVSVVAWLPVLVDQFWGTGNVGRMASFAGSSERPSLGPVSGLRQAVRALGVPPLLLRTDLTGDDIRAPLGVASWIAGALVSAALVALVVRDRRRLPARAALAATALVVAGVGAWNGSNVPNSLEAGRINFYRWTFVASALTWIALAWVTAEVLVRAAPAVTRARRAFAGAALAALAVVSVLTVTESGPQRRRDQQIFEHERRIHREVLAALDPDDRVLLVPGGLSAGLAVAPSVALQLVEAGHEIGVPPSLEAGYGDHLVADGAYDAGIVIASGRGEVAPGPGRVLVRIDLNAATAGVRAELAAQLEGREIVVAADADDVIEEIGGDPGSRSAALFRLQMLSLGDAPDGALLSPAVVDALAAGYLEAPTVDPELVRRLQQDPATDTWGEDVIEVRLLDRGALEREYPSLVG